jgi:hypothetical protein
LWIEVRKQKPFPLRERDCVKRIRLLVEPFHFIHMRRADQATIERVRPGVIGTLNRLGQPAPGRFTESRAAMTADVVVGAQLTGLIAQHDDAFPGDLGQQVVAAIQHCLSAHADPVVTEEPLSLFGEYVGRRVVASRQRSGALLIALDGLQKRRHRISSASFL